MRRSGGCLALVAVLTLASLACSPESDTGTPAAPQDERQTGSVDVGGIELKYVVEGSGRPCLVVGSQTYYPRTFSAEFKQNFRCAYVNTRMFSSGASAGTAPESYTMDVVVDDLERVRRQLGLDHVVVIGHSMHALMALEYAKKYGQHVSHAVMIGMSPRFDYGGMAEAERYWTDESDEPRREILAEQLAKLTDEVMNAASPEQQVVLRYAASGPKYWFDPHYDATWLWEDVEFDVPLMNAFLSRLGEYDVRAGLAELRVPVLVVVGKYDFIVPHVLWDGVREDFPNLSYHVFDRSGHTPQLEEPARFDKTVLDWIAGS